MKIYTKEEALDDYKKVIDLVSDLMLNNREWVKRYHDYLKELIADSEKSKKIVQLMKCCKITPPLSRYSSISEIKNDTRKYSIKHDIRILGYSIGKLDRNKDGLYVNNINISNLKNNILPLINENSRDKLEKLILKFEKKKLEVQKEKTKKKKVNDGFEWKSKEMKSFRSISQNIKTFSLINYNSEHSYENLLLLGLKHGSKLLKNITPIMLINDSFFFQMPTCIRASDAKKDIKSIKENIKYAAEKGGGIDILARTRSNKAKLCVIELKNEYKEEEKPILAIRQAIAYAVFLDYLIRTKDANLAKKSWYSDIFVPNSKSKLLDSIIINVLVAMPFKDGCSNKETLTDEDKNIPKIKLDLPEIEGHKDKINLHYMFFNPKWLKNVLSKNPIENGICTSLFDENGHLCN